MGNQTIVSKLLEIGEDPRIISKRGKTAYMGPFNLNTPTLLIY